MPIGRFGLAFPEWLSPGLDSHLWVGLKKTVSRCLSVMSHVGSNIALADSLSAHDSGLKVLREGKLSCFFTCS